MIIITQFPKKSRLVIQLKIARTTENVEVIDQTEILMRRFRNWSNKSGDSPAEGDVAEEEG